MTNSALDQILDGLEMDASERGNRLKDGAPITIWLLPEDKARYDELQKKTGRKFLPKVRETVLALIEAAESRVKA